jgi:hypothetical protein
MTKEDLSKVIGRALMDKTFAAQVQKDPQAAAKSIGANLSPDETKSLADVSTGHLETVSNSLRSKMNPKAFFDQQQQQQQARMD